MRTIPAGFLGTNIDDLQVCWLVVRRDGIEILGTEHDVDIEITTGTYAGTFLAHAGITGSDIRSTSDLSVDNLEVTGALADFSIGDTGDTSDTSALTLLDLTAADIEAGLLDNAEVTTFLVNSTDPDLYQLVLRSGWIGGIHRTAEGQYKTELRGLTQALSQGIVRTYGVGCDAELGDARCKVDLAAWIETNEVTVVASRRLFTLDHIMFPTQFHLVKGGKCTFTSGLNAGRSMEIKSWGVSDGLLPLQMLLYRPMPEDIAVGDEVEIQIGCNKTRETCINTFNNILNFRGHGIFVPGEHEILKVGKR